MNNDLISRSELKKAIKNLYNETLDGIVKFGIEKAYKEIDNAPTVSLQDIYQEGHYDGHLEGYTKAINEEKPQGDIFPMEIVAGKCPIEVGGNCPLKPKGESFRIEDGLKKARRGNYVIYDVDFLLDNLAREVNIMESARQWKAGKGNDNE